MSAGAALLPLLAAADSQVQTAATRAALSATAHINFKIVIPQVLYLHMGGESAGAAGARTVAIMSNGRTVTLQSSTWTSGDDRSAAHGNLILNAGARRIIAQDAQCAPKNVMVSTQDICTASMP